MDLMPFCSKRLEHESHGTHNPYSKGKWTYATDGIICIRVPRLPEVVAEHGPDAEKLFNLAEFGGGVTVWQTIPPHKVVEDQCKDCGGKGCIRTCGYCYGDGCKRCDHNGIVPCPHNHEKAERCNECYGSGIIKKGSIVMDGSDSRVRISAVHLEMIKELPNVMIAPYDSRSAIRIKFDGGEGLLMPMHL